MESNEFSMENSCHRWKPMTEAMKGQQCRLSILMLDIGSGTGNYSGDADCGCGGALPF